MARIARRARLVLESLEDRALLSAQSATAHAGRSFSYTTPGGAHVVLRVFGLGTLAGTSVRPDGSLDLVFNGTNSSSQITGQVTGGDRQAALHSVHGGDANPNDISGVGTSLLGAVKLNQFNLIDGGFINLAGGIGLLRLNSIGSNTEVELRSLPQTNTTATNPSPTSPTEVVTFVTTATGGVELAGVGGLTTPGAITTTPTTTTNPNLGRVQTPLPPEINFIVNSINGTPGGGPRLQDPQIFGYDPTAQALIRFDALTGAQVGSIPVAGPGNGPLTSGVGIGRASGRQVALVGFGTTVQAYDVVTGASRGQFTTSNLGSIGFHTITGISGTDAQTILVDATAGTNGEAQVIDLNASLATGQAVPVGATFSPSREFFLTGEATGLNGFSRSYYAGAAHFDAFQPDRVQTGILTAASTAFGLSEVSRNALTFPQSIVPAGPPLRPSGALGSIDLNLALDVGAINGANNVVLYDPRTFAPVGNVALQDANLLTGLSETFHPELVNTAIVNVAGTLHEIRAHNVTGLVMNDIGFLNRINIQHASDSAFVGLPIGHIQIPDRSNVLLLSGPRSVGMRGAVTVNPNLRPQGPLVRPVR